MSTATLYAVSHVTGSASSPDNALGAPDNVWTSNGNAATSWTSRWRLDIVAGAFTPSGTQTITLRARKGTNSGNPSIASVTLWQGGTQLATISGGAVTVSSTAGVDETFTFAGSLLTGFTDVDIQVAITAAGGGGTVRNSVELDAITWDTAYIVADPPNEVDLAATESPDAATFAVELPAVVLDPAFEGAAFAGDAFYATSDLKELDLAATETPDALATSAQVFTPVTLDATETPDALATSAQVFTPVTLAVTEGADTAAFGAIVLSAVSLDATEASDALAASAEVFTPVTLDAAETSDALAVSAQVFTPATLAVTETPDALAASAQVFTPATLAVTEASDTASFDAILLDGLVLDATETPDALSASAQVFTPITLAATEAQDTADVQVIRAVPFNVAPGVVTLQGNDAALTAERFFYPEAAQYSYSGNVATLAYYRRVNPASAGYSVIGHTPRLYQSSFFYIDTEIVFVPLDVQHIFVAPESRTDDVITVPAGVQRLTLDFEDRLILMPADLDVERLPEYRDSEAEPRLRAS
jgi:trimeric autotransporter adhesin